MVNIGNPTVRDKLESRFVGLVRGLEESKRFDIHLNSVLGSNKVSLTSPFQQVSSLTFLF